jgi:MFS transporter, FSR family, fosmidomycin resistance protein
LRQAISTGANAGGAAFVVLGAITFAPAKWRHAGPLAVIYPMLKSGFALSFGQIGVLTLIFRVTASLLQPMGGLYTDRRPQPYSLPLGMACSLIGMVTLAKAPYVPISQQGPAFRPYRSSFAAIAVSEYRE